MLESNKEERKGFKLREIGRYSDTTGHIISYCVTSITDNTDEDKILDIGKGQHSLKSQALFLTLIL